MLKHTLYFKISNLLNRKNKERTENFEQITQLDTSTVTLGIGKSKAVVILTVRTLWKKESVMQTIVRINYLRKILSYYQHQTYDIETVKDTKE